MYPGATMIGEEEKAAVADVLNSQSLFRYQGPKFLGKVSAFEAAFAEKMGVKYAVGVSSGTSSLFVSLTAAGVGVGDEVIIPAYSWVATAAAVMATKAVPVLAEVDSSLTLDPNDFEAKITEKTKAVIPVHMRGISCRMTEISRIAKDRALVVIEDCAQSCGASYQGKKLGSIGDIGAFSFQLNKILTAGEGGAVTTNEKKLFERAVMSHDIAALWREKFWGKFESHPFLGLNFRMNEITGAILLEQLKKLNRILTLTRKAKRALKEGIEGLDGIEFREIPDPEGDAGISLIFYLENHEKAKAFADALCMNNLTGPGYGTFVMYDAARPDWHVYPHWKRVTSFRGDECPRTLELLGRAVHMDVSPLLTKTDTDDIINGICMVNKQLSSDGLPA